MKLEELFKDFEVEIFNESSVKVMNLSSNSKAIENGDLFIAKDGSSYNGSDYINEAAQKGAAAILFSGPYKPELKITQIICKNPAKLEAKLAARFYKSPSKALHMVGLTGTNGKTSTSYLICQLLGEPSCGLIGTIEYVIGSQRIDATLTTPDVVSNQKMLSKMVSKNLKFAVMEATSIALTQNRLDGIDFDIALFTNFSQDHLDYHHTMEKYLDAKSLLFERLDPSKKALFNLDDVASKTLIKRCKAHVLTYGQNKEANYVIKNIQLKESKSLFSICNQGNQYDFEIPLIGLYNVYNVVAALCVAVESGFLFEELQIKAKQLKAPNGRLEPIENPYGAQIFVDFAHTEDALKNVIVALKETKPKRLVTVFGCGGDRDPLKRPSMGKTVSSLSDVVIITSDNPRSENPQKICKEVSRGCEDHPEVYIEPDRKKALENALSMIQEGDVLLVAGRGHEKFQLINGQKKPFQDALVIKELIEKHEPAAL